MPPEVNPHSSSASVGAAIAAEDFQLRAYRNEVEQHNRNELEQISTQHQANLAKLIEANETQKEMLRKDFDVAISQEAEHLEESLSQARDKTNTQITDEKKNADLELTKIRRANTQKMDEYKKVSEAQLEAQRKELQSTAETLEEKKRTLDRKDRELEKPKTRRLPA